MGSRLDFPFDNIYWVVEGKLLAGEYPGHYNPEIARARLRSLLKAGIRSWVDLTMERDSSFPYWNILQEEAEDMEVEVVRENYPILDFSFPAEKIMTQILDRIDLEMSAGRPVYVHCIGGIGRTGMVIGCYLVRNGMKGEDAILQIGKLRENVGNWWRSSPETAEQADLIRNWKVGH